MAYITKEAADKAEASMKAGRMRERDSIGTERKRKTSAYKPGSPYYQDSPDDTPDEVPVRAKAQGDYIKNNSNAGPYWQQDEGVLAPTVRMIDLLRKGKSVDEAADMNNILGNKTLMEGAQREGRKAINSYRGAKENQKEYGMKKGGKVSSASSRADGCAQRGKTKGRMV